MRVLWLIFGFVLQTALLGFLLGSLQSCQSKSPQFNESHAPIVPMSRAKPPQDYVVVKGDTLWDISSRFLQEPWRWPEIWINNPHVKNPHLIYPGDVVAIEWANGRPRWRINSRANNRGKGGQAVPTIPLGALKKYLQTTIHLDSLAYDAAPYVVGLADNRQMAASGISVYATGVEDVGEGLQSPHYRIVRKGQPYVDPVSQRVLGYEAVHIAYAELVRGGEPATLEVLVDGREVKAGDRLFSVNQSKVPPSDLPAAMRPEPSAAVSGQVVAVAGTADMAGLHDVITINRGLADGLAVGQVLRIAKLGERLRNPETGESLQVPSRETAQGVVFEVADGYAQLLLLNVRQEVVRGDLVLGTDG